MTVGTWVDRRLGGRPRYVFCDDRDLVRVPDELRDSVCFVHARFGTQTTTGSGFFIGVDHDPETGRHFTYLVTAAHCVTTLDDDGNRVAADHVAITVNTRGGDAERVEIADPDTWIWHDEADVAVLPFVAEERFQITLWHWPDSADAAFRTERAIGPGDDVFMAGLLVYHPGRNRIMPIVRVGSIAALPDDPVDLSTGPDVVALVEMHSIGGLSGGPVFVHLPFWRDAEKGGLFVGGGGVATSGGSYHLLGVMHGFFPTGKNDPDNVSGGDEKLNTGIACVAYVDRVADIVDHPSFVEERRRIVDEVKRAATPIPTSSEDSAEFDAFEDLTQKLLTVSKDELDAARESERRGDDR